MRKLNREPQHGKTSKILHRPSTLQSVEERDENEAVTSQAPGIMTGAWQDGGVVTSSEDEDSDEDRRDEKEFLRQIRQNKLDAYIYDDGWGSFRTSQQQNRV